MDNKLFIGLFFFLILCGCNDSAKNNNSNTGQENQRDPSYKDVFSDGDYNFQVEYNNRMDTSYFDVVYKGKKVSRLGYSGKVEKSFLADLNRDEKNEVYLEMKKESASKVFGYYLNNGELLKINVDQPRHLKKVKASSYKVERNQLIGTYKYISKERKVVTHESRFNLVKREGGYILLPQGLKPHVMQKMTGQYLAKNASTPGYYKSLVVGQREGGKWRAEIQVKRTKDRSVVCEFSGIGEFIDGDLYVPLNQENPELKGTLQIRFIGLLAAVYTAEQENGEELVSFCPERGSIAGNFKKTEI